MERGGTPTPRPFPLRSAFRCARPHPLLNNSFGTFFARRRRRRFFVLKDSCLAYYMHPSDDTPLDAVLFDGFTSVHLDNDKSSTSSFTLLSSSRTLTLKCSCHSEAAIWVDQIQKITTLAPIQSGPYTFGSATPMRGNTCIAPLVCAHDYFLAVGKALEKATTEIFIAGWWLSPDIQLNRTNPKQRSGNYLGCGEGGNPHPPALSAALGIPLRSATSTTKQFVWHLLRSAPAQAIFRPQG